MNILSDHQPAYSMFTDLILWQVAELFTESKKELDECSTVLQYKEKELEETQQTLQESKLRLSQEEFVASALETTEKKLHNTANKVWQ